MFQERLVQYYINYDKSTLALAPRSEISWAVDYISQKTNCGLVRIWCDNGWWFYDADEYVIAVDSKLGEKIPNNNQKIY